MSVPQKYLFVLKPDVTAVDLKEAIHDVLGKSKAVLTFIIFAMAFVREEVELDSQTLFGALCVTDDFLNELMQLYQQLGMG